MSRPGFREIVKDEGGVAVVLGLVALLVLTALMLAFVSVSAFEPQIAANLAAATQARYLAEAGVEAAFDGLASIANWSTAIDASTGATCTTGAIAPATLAASAMPGLAAAAGMFTARVRNDCFAGNARIPSDTVLTGLADEDAGGAHADTNDRLVIVSTGTVGSASKTITAVVRKISLPPISAALALVGTNTAVDTRNAALTISGVDTRMGLESAGAGSAVLGIAVGQAAGLAGIAAALAASAQTSVSGRSAASAAVATGDGAVGHVPSPTSAAIADFVGAIKRGADVSIASTAASPYTINGIGESCASSTASPTCWGTPAHPKIVVVKGDGGHDAVRVSGRSSGTGILVVEDGALDISGSFRWNGPVIVTGRGAKVRSHGDEPLAIWGALIVNETAGPDGAALEGAARIAYSTEAIDGVRHGLGARRFMTLSSWQEQ